MDDDYLPMGEAADVLGVSRITLWRIVKSGRLPVYASPVNRRVRLVKRADLEALKRPIPVEIDEEKAAA